MVLKKINGFIGRLKCFIVVTGHWGNKHEERERERVCEQVRERENVIIEFQK